MLEKQKEPEVG